MSQEEHFITYNGPMPADGQEIEIYDKILKTWRLARYLSTGWFKVEGLDSEIPVYGGRFTKRRPLEALR